MSQSVDVSASVDSVAYKKSAEAQINAHIMDIVKVVYRIFIFGYQIQKLFFQIFQNISDPLINDGILTKFSDAEKEKIREELNKKEILLEQKEKQIRTLEETVEELKDKYESLQMKEKEYVVTIKGFEKSLSSVMADQQVKTS